MTATISQLAFPGIVTTENVVMTLPEAATWLKIDEPSLLAAANDGKIPCQFIGQSPRFSRAAVLNWLSGTTVSPERILHFPSGDESEAEAENFMSVLKKNRDMWNENLNDN